ncbi:hypothetical protein BDN72DRAFT_563461 [Pluteus cervinus]|uniref:Uncharacterized protein n=1 Tax=Pluteus cervinus TaxID=181527 RepID=A0ACD3BBX4_9AGAR|nr:hypothetical protein BDN72DRAFT_563461 [Pluteus cervinus]
MPSHPQTLARRDAPNPAVRLNDKPLLSPATPAVTGLVYPSPIDAQNEMVDRGGRYASYHPQPEPYADNDLPSVDDVSDNPPDNALDDVWRTIQAEKTLKMAKERPKVKSLEEPVYEPGINEQLHIDVPLAPSHESPPRPALTRQKSITAFRESTDGRSIVATFMLPQGLSKQDVHVSFRKDRLIVTWETIEEAEWEAEEGFVRERLVHVFHRTIPLAEGTRFEEVYCSMNGRRLSLRYPNMRCVRVDNSRLVPGGSQ